AGTARHAISGIRRRVEGTRLPKEEEMMDVEAACRKPGPHQPRDFLSSGVLRLGLDQKDPGCSPRVERVSHQHSFDLRGLAHRSSGGKAERECANPSLFHVTLIGC